MPGVPVLEGFRSVPAGRACSKGPGVAEIALVAMAFPAGRALDLEGRPPVGFLAPGEGRGDGLDED
jgi:hypothetical protein